MSHSFITDLLTKVFDLKTIMEITDYKDIRMLIERYIPSGLDHKMQAVRSLDSKSSSSTSEGIILSFNK